MLVLALILEDNDNDNDDGNGDELNEKASTCGEAKNANVTARAEKDVVLKYTILFWRISQSRIGNQVISSFFRSID